MVRDDDQVRDVAAEVLASGAAPVLVVHSTVAPGTPAELEALGVRVLDAPVSGGPMGAADGSLAIMVGGAEAAYAVAEPVLARMGSKVVHAGPLGAGTRMKLARNLIHFVAFTAVTEAQRLAEASGLDLVALGEVVRHTDAITGGPGAIMYRDTTAPLDPDDFWYGVFDHVRALGEKDLSFAIELADTLGVDVPLAQLARERLAKGTGALMGKFDDLPEERRRGLEKMEEVYGFEMSDGDGRLLPLHRRPPLRRHLEPARPLRPRPPAAADRAAGRHRRPRRAHDPGARRATRPATSTRPRCARS